MPSFVQDTFTEASTDKAIAAHVGEIGATWSKHPTASGGLTVAAATDRAFTNSGSTGLYLASGAPSGADYDVTGVFYAASFSFNQVGIAARFNATAFTGYVLSAYVGIGGSGQWMLTRYNAGSSSTLATFAQTFTGGQAYTARMELRGGQIKVFIDGVQRMSVTDGSPLAGPGQVGIYSSGSGSQSTDMQLDQVFADNAGLLLDVTDEGTSDDSADLTVAQWAVSDEGTSDDTAGLAVERQLAVTDDGTSDDQAALRLTPRPHIIAVREQPPLRTSIRVTTPNGREARWAGDEPDPENVPSGQSWSSTMPGGYEQADMTLPRKPGVDYPDLERLSTLQIVDAGGQVVGEYRLERAPRVSGDQVAVSPGCVGWQAHLEDDKSVRMVYIDRDLARWQGPSVQRQVDLGAPYSPLTGPSTAPDADTSLPGLKLEVSGQISGASGGVSEAYYDAGAGVRVAAVGWDAIIDRNVSAGAWGSKVFSTDTDHGPTYDQEGVFTGTGAAEVGMLNIRRWVMLQLLRGGAYTGDALERWRLLRGLYVLGDHGITTTGSGLERGVRASDVVEHAITRWAPQLVTTFDSITESSFAIPHLTFTDPTTAAEIIRQVTRFELQDWAVWANRTFHWHPRGSTGRTWRARIAPAQLQETGPQIDRLWESVVVAYQDADGSARTVGPTGSGADTENSRLKDLDSSNPANQMGITRRALLQAGISTPAGATEIGVRFLEAQKMLDSSGQAQFVGHVEDDRGIRHPYHHVRAGDQVVFVDAADTSPRRIVRARHDADNRTCSVDLDAPPEALDALLERLGVVLTPLGL